MDYKLTFSTDEELYRKCFSIFQKALVERNLWVGLFQMAYAYCLPNRNQFYEYGRKTPGMQKDIYTFDTTAPIALRTAVAKMQQIVMPPQQQWLRRILKENSKNILQEQGFETDELQKSVDRRNRTIFDYIHNSNLELVVQECFYDIMISTGVIQVVKNEDDDDPFTFYSIPLQELYLCSMRDGSTLGTFRQNDIMTIADILSTWPEAKIPAAIQAASEGNPAYECKTIIEGEVYCGKELNKSTGKFRKKYVYVVMLGGEIIFKEFRYMSPWVVARMNKLPGESYGRGPVLDGLAAIGLVNGMCRHEVAASALAIAPPVLAFNDNVFNPYEYQIAPNQVLVCAPTQSGAWPIQQLQMDIKLQYHQVQLNDLRQQIQLCLYGNPLGPIDAPPKTATETAYRQRQYAELVGGAFPRMFKELLYPIYERVEKILEEKGLIEPLPVPREMLSLRYVSPIAQAQFFDEVQLFTQFFTIVQQIMGPEKGTLSIDVTKLPEYLCEKMGFDASIVNSSREIQDMVQEMVEQASAAAQQQEEMQGAQAMAQAPQIPAEMMQ